MSQEELFLEVFRVACTERDVDKASRLLEDEKIDPSAGWGHRNMTPLHWACRHGVLDLVKLLIERYRVGPEITLRGEHEETPLHLAAVEGHLDVVKYLTIEAGCDPNPHSLGYQRPPITYSCGLADFPHHYSEETKALEVVKYLYTSCHCNPDFRDAFGMTALHNACINRRLLIARYLASECDCKTNLVDSRGNLPLHLACGRFPLQDLEHPATVGVDIIRLLVLQRNCDPSATNFLGESPLDIAEEPEIIAELVGYGAQGRKAGMYKNPESFLRHSSKR